jgi:hypothetical protein
MLKIAASSLLRFKAKKDQAGMRLFSSSGILMRCPSLLWTANGC